MVARTQAATGMTFITTHYIDGVFVESHGRQVIDVIRPTDGRVIAHVTLADEEDTRRAIAAATRAFATYGSSTPEERAKILRRLHQAAAARADDLTAAMVEEYGGVVQFAGLIVQSGINAFLAAEQALHEIPWTRRWGKTTVTLEPVGVAGLITAWNANALFMCLKLASAVAAGCTVVIKPSELSALQARVLVEALHEADLPTGLLNVVTGAGSVVGAELVGNPDVAKISFTGSVAVGENIMRDSGEGHPEGLEAGYFVKPTVFVNVRNDMSIAQEEIFGPVLSVIAYDSDDDAIRIANDSKYGLHAAVIGTDLARARRVASRLRAGRVVINNMTDDPQAPWGGFKFSGVGREYGRYGIEAFLEARAILES